MARGEGTLFSVTARGTIGKILTYSQAGLKKIIRLDRLDKEWGSPLVFFEDAFFGILYSMHTDHPWFSFYSLSHFFTYFTKKCYTSNTPGQQNIRSQFTAGYTAWSNLTEEQKAVYEEKAVSEFLTGYNVFMKEYIKENYVPL